MKIDAETLKKQVILHLPYVLFLLVFAKLGEAVRLAPGSDASTKLLNIMTGLNTAFHSLVPSFHPIDLCVGVAAAIAIRLAVYIKGKNAKKFRKNLEYGSARWGTAEDIKPYVDPAFENNIILTQTERLTMNSRPKDPKTARNKNVLIVGGSGSGKTRFWLKPNLLQCTSKTYPTSFVVTDPKGDIVVSCGHALQKNGYQIKILNSLNFKKSMHYNPFAYIHSEKDILKLVTTLIANTKGEGEKSAEDFWVKSERLFYTALIGYIWYEAPAEEMNFTTLLEMINASEAREDDPEFQSPVETVERLKRQGFTDKTMQDWTFANDNGSCPQMKNAAGYVARWEQIKDGNYGLLLWGRVGTGKSYFAGCIANALMEQELSLIHI